MGARASGDGIRTGEQVALIEGIFELEVRNEDQIAPILKERGIELFGDEYLTIRREVHLNGRSRIFINDRSATVSTLRVLQPYLIEIHGQGEQRSLLSPRTQLLLLDDFAGCNELRQEVFQKYEVWRMLKEELEHLSKDEVERERELDMLRYQIAEIEQFDPKPGEELLLYDEKKILTASERLIELGTDAYQTLYESDDSVLSGLSLVKRNLQELEIIDSRFTSLLRSLEEASVTILDIADSLRLNSALYNYSPLRLKEIEDRLIGYERLKRKHGREFEDLMTVRKKLSDRLLQLSNGEERLGELLDKHKQIQKEYHSLVGDLTKCRNSAVKEFEKRVNDELRQVAMSNAHLHVVINTASNEADTVILEEIQEQRTLQTENSIAAPQSPRYWSPTGADHIEFYLTANIGEQSRPLQRIASGGELSRLMLILRTICLRATVGLGKTSAATTTMVFDEIDSGIGGREAEAVGLRLKSLSASQQVLCVTHQSQIARFATHHYAVAKFIGDGRTSTRIRQLNREERITELSRMLGVSEDVVTARQTAQWLLDTAEEVSFPLAENNNPLEPKKHKSRRKS